MYDRLLVPTDGSSATQETLAHAFEMAERYGATIHALAVVDERQFSQLDGEQRYETQAALRQNAETAVKRVADRTPAALTVTTAVREGHPSARITEYADAHETDVIVIGTHGRTGDDAVAPVGSVTERVVKTASVPVFVVHI